MPVSCQGSLRGVRIGFIPRVPASSAVSTGWDFICGGSGSPGGGGRGAWYFSPMRRRVRASCLSVGTPRKRVLRGSKRDFQSGYFLLTGQFRSRSTKERRSNSPVQEVDSSPPERVAEEEEPREEADRLENHMRCESL